MTHDPERPPEALLDLVRRRSAARAARDFATADALRTEIEAAGWRPVDHGTHTTLERAVPADVMIDGVVHYGSPASVPSRLDDPATAAATLLVVVGQPDDGLGRLLAAVRQAGRPDIQVVVVAAAAAVGEPARLTLPADHAADLEVVRLAAPLGRAASLAAGLRRATGRIVVFADPSVEPTGDAVSPLAGALADPAVAVAGDLGLASADLRHVEPTLAPDPLAIEGSWLAVRRDDAARPGVLDERFVEAAWLDLWLSVVIRLGVERTGLDDDARRDDTGDAPPTVPSEPSGPALRAARRLDLPLVRHGEPPTLVAQGDRSARRQFYRWLDLARAHPELGQR
ncbi:MAG TPA: glycosyltransferase [Candidatus Limnocylindrales bacterium]